MSSVRHHDLPASALLSRYRNNGAYTDCYAIDINPDYSYAFYTSWLFKLL